MKINITSLETIPMLDKMKYLDELQVDTTEEIDFIFNPSFALPTGMLLLSSSIRNFCNKHIDCRINFTVSVDSQAKDYAGHMGLFRSISESICIGMEPGEAYGSSTYVPITKINFSELHRKEIDNGNYVDLNDTIENESKRLAGVLCQSNTQLKELFSYIIREILRNTPEHADSDTSFICAQYWPRKHEAEISILDEGIGLKRSLQKNKIHKEYVKNDRDAVEIAVQPGISQAFSPSQKAKRKNEWSNSGFGLFMASEICKELSGEFWIISGDTAMKVNDGKNTFYSTNFSGTAISIRFGLESVKNAQEIITKISKRGEEKAKKIRNAFHEASTPSKSLVIEKANRS